MAKTYSIHEVRQRLAKRVEEMIDRVAGDVKDLVKKESLKKSLWATAHEEPGMHEAEEPGVDPHMEPGGHEKFAMSPPASPEAATAAPVHGGIGVPPGQLDNPGTPGADPGMDPMSSMIMGEGPCPLCQQPEQNCKCLDAMILGKSLAKNASMGYGGGAGAGAAAPAAAGSSLAMSEMCKHCNKSHGIEKCSDGLMPHPGKDPVKKGEANPGANDDPSKKQPTPPVDGAKLPPEAGGKKVKSQDGKKPKENGLGKADVPQAKPPSGKVPGGTSNPPMASTSSKQTLKGEEPEPPSREKMWGDKARAEQQTAKDKEIQANHSQMVHDIRNHGAAAGGNGRPWVRKDEALDKAVLNPQAQQHMQMDSSKAAAPKTPAAAAGGAPQLTHPAEMGRANAHAAALAGEFQPKGAISSGLELAPKGLSMPPPGVRQQPGAAPKLGLLPKPMGIQPTVPPKGVHPNDGGFGSLFGKSEKCALCHKAEHVGECN